MDLKKVKLVVFDMDGTLLNTQGRVSQYFFELFEKLQKQQIIFCAASGRQYNSIVEKLAPIKEAIYVIAENGGVAKKGDEVLLLKNIAPSKVNEILPVLRNIKDTNIVLCTLETAFIESTDPHFIQLFQEYYSSYRIVNDLSEVAKTNPVLKIAVYHFSSSEIFIYPNIKHLENEYLLKVSGPNWLDISTHGVHKGNALKEVQQLLDISKEETMVFGDYLNDLEMFEEADFSFAMENAHNSLKKISKYTTKSNTEFGVEEVLEKLTQANTTS
jgi:Cof subfamily protein (haloacid dehalogenase superfamily)